MTKDDDATTAATKLEERVIPLDDVREPIEAQISSGGNRLILRIEHRRRYVFSV